jgi:hypothetical protein
MMGCTSVPTWMRRLTSHPIVTTAATCRGPGRESLPSYGPRRLQRRCPSRSRVPNPIDPSRSLALICSVTRAKCIALCTRSPATPHISAGSRFCAKCSLGVINIPPGKASDCPDCRVSSVLTHSFDTPETFSFSARVPRAFFSRMILALGVHLKGFGLALGSASQVSMAASSSATLLNTPRRICWRVISANRRSTRLIQDDDVGVKCSLKRGCLVHPGWRGWPMARRQALRRVRWWCGIGRR